MKFDSLKPGMTVWDAHKERLGNTTMRSVGVWPIYIKEIYPEARMVLASWNGNPARTYAERNVKRWRAEKPVLISLGMTKRLATREELKSIKANCQKL